MLMHITTCLNVTGRLCAVSLCLMLLFPSPPALAADRAGDEFLTGYIVSILDRGLHWRERQLYFEECQRGLPRLHCLKMTRCDGRRRTSICAISTGLQGIAIVVKPADAGKPGAASRFMGSNRQSGSLPNGRPVPATYRRPEAAAVLCQPQPLQIIGCAIHHDVRSALEKHSAYTGSSVTVRGTACN